jgi:hypothetical protein
MIKSFLTSFLTHSSFPVKKIHLSASLVQCATDRARHCDIGCVFDGSGVRFFEAFVIEAIGIPRLHDVLETL